MISFMCQKNIFSEDIFFCQQVHGHSQFVTTTCHRHVTQNKKFLLCCNTYTLSVCWKAKSEDDDDKLLMEVAVNSSMLILHLASCGIVVLCYVLL